MARANSQLSGGPSGPRNAPKPLLGLRSCSFARFWMPLAILCSHWRPEIQIYCHKRGGARTKQTTKTAPKDAQQRVRETAAEERCLESFVAVFADTMATRLSGGSARRRKAHAARKAVRMQRRGRDRKDKEEHPPTQDRKRHVGVDRKKDVRESMLESPLPPPCVSCV